MESGNFSTAKQSESKKLLADFDFNLRGFLEETIKLLSDPYTYDIKYNPFLWFGLAIASLIPAYLLIYGYYTRGEVFVTEILIYISLAHVLGMGLTFGALGSLYWKHHANLQHQASHDELTNLLNHGTFQEVGKRRFAEARRYDKILSLIFLDLDHFKRVNDTFGHTKGDEVLMKVARHLREKTRSSDIVARYGGEEFAILLPETPLNYSYKVAERIREAIEHNMDDLPDFLSLSAGVGAYPVNGQSLSELIEMVDECLYYAKEHGRNQVITVPELPESKDRNRKHFNLQT